MLPELMPDTEPSGGKAPVDIQVWTPDAAGAAFQTSFVADTDPVVFELVDISRTDIQAGLIPAICHADLTVDNFKMRRFINIETIKKKFVFYGGWHQTLLKASQQRRSKPGREWFFLKLRQIILCFSFFDTPFTVSISRAAKLKASGSVVKISLCS